VQEKGEEALDEHRVAEVVGCELDFVAVFTERGRDVHDAGGAHQEVESVVLEACCGGFLDGCHGAEIHREERYSGRGMVLVDFGDELFGGFLVAA